ESSPLRLSTVSEPGVALPGSTTSSGGTPEGKPPLVVGESGSTGAPRMDRRCFSPAASRLASCCWPSVSLSKLRLRISVSVGLPCPDPERSFVMETLLCVRIDLKYLSRQIPCPEKVV